ncbi:methylosome subunit pICln-like [Convolutriloba macropyga]|uniref:methylosome subunit pICln-like n=1 Tax=Convolutriloba macropyga TaxID=536237 RepID=UPI003F526D26
MALGYVTAPTQTAKIHHQEQNTEVFVDQTCLGKGIVYITEDNVVWQSTDGTGFELFYPNIQLHAISRDKNAFLKDCLYLMVEGNVLPVSASSNRDMQMVQPVAEDANSDDEDQVNLDVEDDMCCEVRFCPDNVLDLEPMFQAMNHCQELHPDPTMNDSDDSDNNDFGECDFTQFGAGDGMISILSGPGQQLHEGGDQSEGAAVPGMEQFFTPDGQFSDDIMQQLQSGQQVHIDFTSNTVTATDPASANETEQASNGGDAEQMEMEDNNTGS